MAVAKRIWEIDFLRGIAIICMIIFHLVVDLADFYGYNLNYLSGFWYYEGRLSAVMFMLLAGVSVRFNEHSLRHGVIVLGWGMVVTLITYLYDPRTYVHFGILHLIGSGLLLSYVLRGFTACWRCILATLLLVGGAAVKTTAANGAWLLPLGIVPVGFTSLDYYPLLPWGGVVLLGTCAGSWIYQSPSSLLRRQPDANFLTYIGRHSLWIYLLHQPVMLVLLWMIYR